MRTVAQVAVNVFKESVRDKVLYNLVAFAVLLMAASYLIGQLTAGQDVKIIKDLGLAATGVFGLFIAIFIGIGLVSLNPLQDTLEDFFLQRVAEAGDGARAPHAGEGAHAGH